MIGALSLLGILLFICVVIWAARALLNAFSIQDPIRTVIWVAIVLICVLAFIGQLQDGPFTLQHIRW